MAKFLDDTLAVFSSRLAIIVLGLLKAVIIARTLGPALNGTISVLVVYPSLFMAFGSLGLRKSSAYFIGKGIISEDEIKAAIMRVWLILSILSVLVCFFLIRFFSSSGSNLTYVILAIIPVPFALLINYISGIYLGRNEIRGFNRINWIPPLIILLSTFSFVYIGKWSITGALMAELMGPLIMTAILLWKNNIFKYFAYKVNFSVIKSLLSLGVTYATLLMLANLNYRIDTVILDKFSTPFEVGIYSKGSVMIQYLWHIPLMLGTLVFARSAAAKDRKAFSYKVCQLMRLSIVIIGIGCLILALISKYILVFLFGPAFIDSVSVLVLLSPGVLIMCIFKVLNMDISGQGKPWLGIRALLTGLVVNILVNLYMIPRYGANGAAISSTISYSFIAIYYMLIYSKHSEIPVREILAFSRSDFNVFENKINKFLKRKPKPLHEKV